MRICFIMPYFYREKSAGAEIQSYLIAGELAKRGYDVYYLCGNLNKNTPEEEIVGGIKVQRKLKNLKIFKFLNFFLILAHISHLKYQIYYQRMASPYTGIVGIISKLTGGKFIWACSEDATLEKNYFIKLQLNHFKGYAGNFIKKTLLLSDSIINQILFNLGIKLADVCIVQNNYQKQKLFENYGRNGIIIRSGHIPAKGKIEKDNPPIVLWLNGISKRKQPALFIELARQCQELNCKFIMIGGQAKKDYLNSVLSKAKDLPNFEYIGEIPFEETNRWFRKASIYVNTTIAGREGLPNTFIQSWLNETPVISLNVNPDNILTEYNIGIHSKNFEQLVKDVKFLLGNQDVRLKMGKTSREFAEKTFNINDIVDRYEMMIKQLYKKR